MLGKAMVLAIGSSALMFGCGTDLVQDSADVDETVENLRQAGFPENDIMVVDGLVYVGRDAEVSLEASREMLVAPELGSEEQYRTTNTVSRTLTRICISAPGFTGVFSTALTAAINNYNALPLTFDFARAPTTGCQFTISGVIQAGLVGGSAGFPSGGRPFGRITIGGGLSTFPVSTIEHVITHELGHTMGMRHSDWFNRSISCGSGGSEGTAGVGAVHITGTPTGATVGGSIMNSCFRQNESGNFTASDVTAWNTVY